MGLNVAVIWGFNVQAGSSRKNYSVISRYKPWATAAIVLELLEVAGRTAARRKHRRSLRKERSNEGYFALFG